MNLPKKNETLKSLRELKLLKECLQKSERKYDSIIISNLKDHNEIIKCIFNVTLDILKQFAGTVSQLTFLNTSLQDNNFFEVIRIIKNLKTLKFEGRGCDEIKSKVISGNERPDIVSAIEEISIKEVFGFLFAKLYMFDNIITLDVNDWWSTDFETFENFLFLQKSLKVLHLRKLRDGLMFETDKLSNNIKFSLDVLSLNAVYWKDNKNAMKFFKTQTNLKNVSLHLKNCWWTEYDEKNWYNELCVHLFGNNPYLKTVYLSTHEKYGYNIKDFSFFEGIVNPSVEILTLNLDPAQNATECITAFTKLFPNVKQFTYTVNNEDEHGLDLIQNWKSLESINFSLNINHYVENINLVEKLTTCTITNFDEERKLQMLKFLTRHQNIKHISIYSYYNKIIPDEILVLIVNTLKSLESLICDEQNCPLSNYLKNSNLSM